MLTFEDKETIFKYIDDLSDSNSLDLYIDLKDLKTCIDEYEPFPVFIPSLNYTDKRSTTISKYLNNDIPNKVFIVAYEFQSELYDKFNQFNNVEVIYKPAKTCIGDKRQFICDLANDMGYKHIFMLDDDIEKLGLPVPLSGKTYNRIDIVNLNVFLRIWQHMVEKHNLPMSCTSHWGYIRFRKLMEQSYINEYRPLTMFMCLDVQYLSTNGLAFIDTPEEDEIFTISMEALLKNAGRAPCMLGLYASTPTPSRNRSTNGDYHIFSFNLVKNSVKRFGSELVQPRISNSGFVTFYFNRRLYLKFLNTGNIFKHIYRMDFDDRFIDECVERAKTDTHAFKFMLSKFTKV